MGDRELRNNRFRKQNSALHRDAIRRGFTPRIIDPIKDFRPAQSPINPAMEFIIHHSAFIILRHRPTSASTGSSLAARLAGTTPKTTPTTRDTASDATTAHMGAAAGNVG